MGEMFYDCKNLDVVYVGANWDTSNAETPLMWQNAKINKVTIK